MEDNIATPISVSVSPLFRDLLKDNALSPTEVFRVGLAVMLAEKGNRTYSNTKNLERLKIVEKELESLDNMEQTNKLLEKAEAVLFIKKNFQKIKELLRGI